MSFYRGRIVVVAGGAGFIGAHMVRSLLDQGAKVVVLDNFQTGVRDRLSPHANLKVVEHDVVNPYELPELDVVFNLACPASPPHYQSDPIKTWRTALYGTDQLLELAYLHRARFVQASTSEIYGEPEQHPQRESYRGNTSTLGPRACYDEGKRAGETIVMDFVRVRDIDARIARIFNTYGPGMSPDDGRVVSNFATQVLRGDPVTIYGSGEQTRSFCYVSDLVCGLLLLGSVDGIKGEVVNLGNPSEISVATLVEEIARLVDHEIRTVVEDLPVDDPTRRQPDISHAKLILNWEPVVSLHDGLNQTLNYFASIKSKKVA